MQERVRAHALAHPAWGHRKIWAMVRHDGHIVSQATVLRLLREEGLILPAAYQRERRKLAERRKTAFAQDPSGPNQVWQLDFTEFETTTGGTWRIAGAPLGDGEPARRDRRPRARPGRGSWCELESAAAARASVVPSSAPGVRRSSTRCPGSPPSGGGCASSNPPG